MTEVEGHATNTSPPLRTCTFNTYAFTTSIPQATVIIIKLQHQQVR
jgi:hypothetical protein